MGKDSIKYNPCSELKKRTSLGAHSNSKSYSQLIGFSRDLPKTNKFIEKDLGNGFREFIEKK